MERLMIDTKFQNMGYGKEALIQGIHWFDQNISENVLRISAVKTNDVALKLYEKLSFIRTGEELEGEIVFLKMR
ncbi:MAG TPA: GNAT family protein [Enterococcus sp.]|nr:GNAT family protein [Enterococcus sp.]